MDSTQGDSVPTVRDDERARAQFLQPQLAAFPGAVRACADPPVYVIPGFLNPSECEALAAAGAPGLHRSIVVDGTLGKAPAPSRTSESCYLTKDSTAWLADRVAVLTGKPPATQEPPQVARYTSGGYYLAHYDAFDLATAPGRECCLTGGQRVATVLIYLNSVAQG